MGFAPHQVDRMEPYQFAAAWRGWRTANTTPKARVPSDEEFRLAVAATVH
jgi:hypothetical protein